MRTLILLLAAFSSAGCAKSEPLGNFQRVEADLFRGAQPEGAGWSMLKRLGVKTIVKLNGDEDLEEERAAARANGFLLIEIPLSGFFAPSAADERLVQAALWNPSLRPLFFHCRLGQDRTGLAAALYRVHEQGWQPAAAHREWMELGHSPLLFLMDHFFEEHTE